MEKIKYLFIRVTNLKPQGFWSGFLVGFFYFGFIFWWFWDLYPLDSFGLESKMAAVLILGISFILYVTTMALPWGFFSLLFKKIVPKNSSNTLISFFIASIFTLTEYFRAIFFSIILYGSGGVVGPHWTMGNIAYWFIDLDFLSSTASIWGIYGIDFVLVAVSSSVLIWFLKIISKKIFLTNLIIIIILILTANFITTTTNLNESNPISIALIQTDAPSNEFGSNVEILEDLKNKLDLIQRGAKEVGEGIILFPEGAGFSTSLAKILDVDGVRQYFDSLSNKELLVVDSIRSLENDYYKSKATFISSLSGMIDFYDKEILVPGGEFLPYLIKFPLTFLRPTLRKEFKFYREYLSGGKSNIITYKDSGIKILICSDFISPIKSRGGQSNYILSLGNFSVWGDSSWANQQAEPILRFRAIENAKYLAFTSNGGRSYVINPTGKIDKTTNSQGYELLTGVVVPNDNRTWYNYVGDWPILLISLAFFGLGFRKIKNDWKY